MITPKFFESYFDTLPRLKYAGFSIPANGRHRARWFCYFTAEGGTLALCGTNRERLA